MGYTEKLKPFHLDVKEGPALSCHHEILQTTSSKPCVLLSRNLMRDARQNRLRKPE